MPEQKPERIEYFSSAQRMVDFYAANYKAHKIISQGKDYIKFSTPDENVTLQVANLPIDPPDEHFTPPYQPGDDFMRVTLETVESNIRTAMKEGEPGITITIPLQEGRA